MKRSHRRHKNPQGKDEKQKTFFRANTVDKKKDDSFFQSKSEGVKINKAGDKDEQEADTVAAKVINRSTSKETIQNRKKGIIQKLTLSTPKEDEKLGTAEQRMEKDKYIQEMAEVKSEEKEEDTIQSKPELQQQEENKEEETVQNALIQEEPEYGDRDLVRTDFSDREKEESSVAKQGMGPEEEVDKKSSEKEEEDLQTKLESGKEEEDKESMLQTKKEIQKQEKQEPEETIQTKSEYGNEYTNAELTDALKRSKGKGRPLSSAIRREMEAHFKCSFKNVKIHTGQQAVWMCKQLHAQAFTNGYDIYFNQGKFTPETSGGKQLLVHELTHVVQQMFRPKK